MNVAPSLLGGTITLLLLAACGREPRFERQKMSPARSTPPLPPVVAANALLLPCAKRIVPADGRFPNPESVRRGVPLAEDEVGRALRLLRPEGGWRVTLSGDGGTFTHRLGEREMVLNLSNASPAPDFMLAPDGSQWDGPFPAGDEMPPGRRWSVIRVELRGYRLADAHWTP